MKTAERAVLGNVELRRPAPRADRAGHKADLIRKTIYFQVPLQQAACRRQRLKGYRARARSGGPGCVQGIETEIRANIHNFGAVRDIGSDSVQKVRFVEVSNQEFSAKRIADIDVHV